MGGNSAYERTPAGFFATIMSRLTSLERRIGKLPDRLTATGEKITDWNSATAAGFYYGIDAANGPATVDGIGSGVWLTGIVQWHDAAGGTPRIIQMVRQAKTDYARHLYVRYFNGTSWTAWTRQGAPLQGTAAQRATFPAQYWEFWQDTDGSQKLYVGNKSGGWRLFSGNTSWSAAAWTDSASGTPSPLIMAGRTINLTIPTVLETTEHLMFQLATGGTGYTFIGGSAITRGASDTTLTFRYMQLMSLNTQGGSINWQVAQI